MKTTAFLFAGLLLAGSASAQAVKQNTGFYVGVDGGLANSNMPGEARGYRTTSQPNNAATLRNLVGYQFTPNWALEAGHFNTSEFNKRSINGPVRRDASASARGIDMAAIYKLTSVLPGMYVKAGLTYGTLSTDSSERVGGVTRNRSSSSSGTGYLFGLGYEYDFTPNWTGSVGYTRMQRVGGVKDANVNLTTVGIRYRF